MNDKYLVLRDTVGRIVSDSWLKKLATSFFMYFESEDHPKRLESFEKAQAAEMVHHAYPGGLLDHMQNMIDAAIPLRHVYDFKRDTVIVGILFHDIGKVGELDEFGRLNVDAILIGHIQKSMDLFNYLVNQIPDFPEDLYRTISHMILSHHGQKEWGSPVVPATIEAYVLHILDLLDSRVDIFSKAIRETTSTITGPVKYLEWRRLYRDPSYDSWNVISGGKL